VSRSDVEPDAVALRQIQQCVAMLQQMARAWDLGLARGQTVAEDASTVCGEVAK